MRTSEMIKSKFFRAADVEGRPPLMLRISGVTEELVQKDMRTFLWFLEHPKGLRINKTNVRVLEAAYGPESDLWTGKTVRLSFDPTVEFGGRAVGGIKLETPPGLAYSNPMTAAAWGQPQGLPPQGLVGMHHGFDGIGQGGQPQGLPPQGLVGASLPPRPVWNPQTGQWVLPPPPQAISTPPAPPQPVWNALTGAWELPSVAPPAPVSAAQAHQAATWGGAPTLTQRMATNPSDWPAPGEPRVDRVTGEVLNADEDAEFGHADIPF